jgi:hypothetical protein
VWVYYIVEHLEVVLSPLALLWWISIQFSSALRLVQRILATIEERWRKYLLFTLLEVFESGENIF